MVTPFHLFRGSVTLKQKGEHVLVTKLRLSNPRNHYLLAKHHLTYVCLIFMDRRMKSMESFLYVISKSDRGSKCTSTTRKVVAIMQAGTSREVAPKTVTCCLRP